MTMEIICGIYKITSPSNKIYIGQAINIYKRWKFYKGLRCKNQRKLYYSFLKYGTETHTFEILEVCLPIELNEREIYYIKFFDTFLSKHGLNLRSGGEKSVMTPEFKEKASKWQRGRTLTKEHCENISKGNKKAWESTPDAEKARRTERIKNMWKENREYISSRLKGLKRPASSKINYSNASKKRHRDYPEKFLGRVQKKETIQKIREAANKTWERIHEEKRMMIF